MLSLTMVRTSTSVFVAFVEAACNLFTFKSSSLTAVEVQTIVKDSIIYRDTSYLKVQAIRWKDPWINVDGLIMPDKKLDLRIQSVDTLFQVVHRVPKQWLFFRWGTKAIRQEVVSSNPHTKIVYSEYIELKKRKKK